MKNFVYKYDCNGDNTVLNEHKIQIIKEFDDSILILDDGDYVKKIYHYVFDMVDFDEMYTYKKLDNNEKIELHAEILQKIQDAIQF